MWSNPDSKWKGFQPVQYLLDLTKVFNLPFKKADTCGADNQIVPVQMTFGEVMRETADWQIKTVESGFDFGRSNGHQTTISTEAESLVLSGLPFNCQLLKTAVDFRSANVNAFDATWFWYAEAEVLDDPHSSYSFFVVHQNKIVSERVTFSDAHDYGFDPTIFDACDTSDIWSDEKGWRDAQARLWYRNFYRETLTGQLMVLRSDEPELFHYPEGELLRRAYRDSADIDVLTRLQSALAALRSK